MNPLRSVLTLGIALACAPAFAQVPAMAGAPSDRPLPPEPGEGRTTEVRAGQDLPQADILTLSEQRELQGVQQGFTTDIQRLDQEYTALDQRSSAIDPSVWSMLEQSRANARARVAATDADRAAMLRDYGVYNEGVFNAQLTMADQTAHNRLVTQRMNWYGTELNRMSTDLSGMPGDQRAEQAMRLIQLRRQHDQLALQHRRLNRAAAPERDAMARQFNTDLARFDTSVRTTTWGWGQTASGSQTGGN